MRMPRCRISANCCIIKGPGTKYGETISRSDFACDIRPSRPSTAVSCASSTESASAAIFEGSSTSIADAAQVQVSSARLVASGKAGNVLVFCPVPVAATAAFIKPSAELSVLGLIASISFSVISDCTG